MNYMSVKEAAEKWDVGIRRVQFLCSGGKIPGAVNIGKQWLIPADLPKPADGRTKGAKIREFDSAPYHFPLFLHSVCYSNRTGLSEEEQQLLNAQLLHVKGSYVESIQICRALLEGNLSGSVKFGCLFTIAINAMLLGIKSVAEKQCSAMEYLCSIEMEHSEDYRLIYSYVVFHMTWNKKMIFEIDPAKLSTEAQSLYQLHMMYVQMFSNDSADTYSLAFYEVYCSSLERDGIEPALLSVHMLLASLYDKDNSIEAKLNHIEKACAIAVKNDWLNLLAKFYLLDEKDISRCLRRYGGSCLNTLKRRNDFNIRNWKIVHNLTSYSEKLNLSLGESELVLLISYGLVNNEIADVLATTRRDVDSKVKVLCKKLGISSKAALTAFLRKELREAPTPDS